MGQFVLTAQSNSPAGVDQIIQARLDSNARIVVVAMSSTTFFDFRVKEIIYTTTIIYKIDNSIVL